MTYDLAILAILWVCVSFLAGFLAHAIWLDFINRKAFRDELERQFMEAHLGLTAPLDIGGKKL